MRFQPDWSIEQREREATKPRQVIAVSVCDGIDHAKSTAADMRTAGCTSTRIFQRDVKADNLRIAVWIVVGRKEKPRA